MEQSNILKFADTKATGTILVFIGFQTTTTYKNSNPVDDAEANVAAHPANLPSPLSVHVVSRFALLSNLHTASSLPKSHKCRAV